MQCCLDIPRANFDLSRIQLLFNSVFFCDLLFYEGQRALSTLLFTHILVTNRWIHAFCSMELRLGFELGSQIQCPTMIIATLSAPPSSKRRRNKDLKKKIGEKEEEEVKAMDCGIVVSKFVLLSRYYVHFEKGMNPLILPAMR